MTSLAVADLYDVGTDRILIDVRTPREFAGGSVPGAVNVPLGDVRAYAAALEDAEQDIVVICRTGARAVKAAETLRAAGQRHVRVLDGGLDRYLGATPESAAAAAGWTLERQVRLVAGSVVAGSIAVSVARPKARFVAGGIGVGLTVAALTDTCTMALALARLPFNRAPRR